MTTQERMKVRRDLFVLQGQIVGLKKDGRRRYGNNRRTWPEGMRAKWEELTARARELQNQLKVQANEKA